jgi:hypothetical protein
MMKKTLRIALCGVLALSTLSVPAVAQISEAPGSLSTVDPELQREHARFKVLAVTRSVLMVSAVVAAASVGLGTAVLVGVPAAAFMVMDLSTIRQIRQLSDKAKVEEANERSKLISTLSVGATGLILAVSQNIGSPGLIATSAWMIVLVINPKGVVDSALDSIIDTFGMAVLPRTETPL